MAPTYDLDDLDYLAPDFDLNSLTVPRLRSILVSHDIPYPASAKKSQLISILEQEVLPKAKKLLRERERVRRTSAGITDMSRQSTAEEDGEGDVAHSTASVTGTRRGRSRPSTRASTAELEDGTVQATPRRRGRPSSRSTRASDVETGDERATTPSVAPSTPQRRSTARKSRVADAPPPMETIEGSPSIKTESRESSVFTDDNPFQSGSSPTPLDRTPRASASSSFAVSSERKRMSTPMSRVPKPSFASERKRDSESRSSFRHADYSFTGTKLEFQSPAKPPSPVKEEDVSEDDVSQEEEEEYGEEFTPEEQLALEAEAEAERARAVIEKPRQASHASRAAPWVVILALLMGFGIWWRQEKIEIGFCGVGKPTWSLANTNVPEWANVLEPQCEPCPPHAFCYPNLKVQCEQDFILTPHPFSFGGLLPLPPTCEPDSEKSRRVKAVADRAVEQLRDRRAKYECGDGNEKVKSPAISEEELKQAVSRKRRKGMSDEEFDELWRGAIGDIVGREEVSVKERSAGLELSSSSTARLPLGCAFRHHIRQSLRVYRLPLSAVVLALAGIAYVRAQIRARQADIARVPELVATTLDRLSTQAALYARGEAPEPWIPIGQLRDDVLRSELKGSRRERLWRRVAHVVEGNANVRAAVREGRGGDVARVWEWIGGLSRLDGLRRSPQSPSSPGEAEQEFEDQGRRESRRWNEGRPIY